MTQDKAKPAQCAIDWTLRTLRAVKAHGNQVSNSNAIVVIVHDPALLRSLAFALGAHGHAVDTFASWRSAREKARGASCVILDGCLSQKDRDDCLRCVPDTTPLILLAEQDTPMPARGNVLTLHKPLAGPDVLSALASFRSSPK